MTALIKLSVSLKRTNKADERNATLDSRNLSLYWLTPSFRTLTMLEVCLESPQPLCTLHSIQFSDFNIHIPQNEFLPTLENFQLTYSYSIIMELSLFILYSWCSLFNLELWQQIKFHLFWRVHKVQQRFCQKKKNSIPG